MNKLPENMEELLSRQICGFHRYCLTEPVHLTYVSRNLCLMVDACEEELLSTGSDGYALRVHPADRKKYSDFIQQLTAKEQELTVEYRIIKKDGSILFVRDTAVSQRERDGSVTAASVLTDITDLKNENCNLRFLNETIPCGFVKCTCETQPSVTYINQTMVDILRFPEVKDGEMDYLEMYKSNIFLMIPMEERRRFSKFLNRVYSSDAPIAGEMTLLRCDGTKARVFGWVTKIINEQGCLEFQSVCMDITDSHQARKASEYERYVKGLADVYDKIFEFNLDAHTVKCLHCGENSSFKKVEGLSIGLEDALEKWLFASVVQKDQKAVRSFFQRFCQNQAGLAENKPPQITYQAHSSDGRFRDYTGIFIKVDHAVSFYCCREIQESVDAEALKHENLQLKENMRGLISQFSDGIAAFEVSAAGSVKPLYASENVCEFFGYTEAEWLPLTQQFTPMENFVMYSDVSYEDFATLFRKGEAEFSYFDRQTETERRIKAVLSQKESNAGHSRYVMLYAVEGNQQSCAPTLLEKRTVSIRTFGYFDVFVGDKPIAFSNKKSKELLALLVDRRGGYITSEEAIGFLWENEPANSVTFSRYRKVALRLKNTLEEYGISAIVETVDGKRRIVMEKVQCDLYDYLTGKEEYSQSFKGSYLANYSWGELTLGALIRDQK